MATVKKKLPYELYDVAGLEDWFARMAAEGYHLVDCWQNKAEFTVASPKKNVRYRLEAQQTYQHDLEKDRAYAEQGWDYVTSIPFFFYIFRCDDPENEELHTDPTIQSWTMKKLIRRQYLSLLVWLLNMVIQFTINFGVRLGGIQEAWSLMICSDAMLLILGATVLFVVHFLWAQVVQLVMLARLKQRLASGLPMDREKRYPRCFWMHGFRWVLGAVLLAAVVGGFAIHQREAEGRAVNIADYPHVSLEDVISGEYTDSVDPYHYQGAKLRHSVLVPVQFTYGDGGYLKGDREQRVRTYLNYYEACSPGAAKLLLSSCMLDQKRGLKTEKAWQVKYPEEFSLIVVDTGAVWRDHDELDELWVWDIQYEDDQLFHRHFFARKGNVAFELTTTLPDPDAALDILLEKMRS